MITNIVVFGGDNATTLQTARCVFFACNIRPLVYIVSKIENAFTHSIVRSRCVGQYEFCKSEDEAIHKLLGLPVSMEKQIMIFASSDSAAEALDANYDKLTPYFIFPCTKNHSIPFSTLMNKEEMSSLALKSGFFVPKTYTEQDIISGNAVFPCIIKPLQSSKGGKLIFVCNTQSEFLEAISVFKSNNILFQIQEYIQKEYEICVLGVAGFNSGKVHVAGAVQKIRESCLCGSFVKVIPDISIDYSIVKSFIEETKYRGPFSFDLIYSKGRYYYLETNFRIDAHLLTFMVGGCNLLQYLYEEFINPEVEFLPLTKVVYGMDERTDFWKVRLGEISFYQWLKDYLKTDCRYLMYSKDKRVFFFIVFYALKQKMISFFRKNNS